MRIVATSDTHHPVQDISKIPDGDVFIHAGDLMQNGYPDEWWPCLKWLAALPHKHKYYIPGNHDLHLQVYPGPALQNLRSIGVTVVGMPDNPNYRKVTLPNGMTMGGIPYVTGLPKWAFNITPHDLELYLYELGRVDIVVSHAQIIGSYQKYIRQHVPKFWIHGHIHEEYGSYTVDNCPVYNVAMCDRSYQHANPPIVIDI